MATLPAFDGSLADLAARFEYHGRHIYAGPSPENASPLYAHLSLQVASDPAILRLLSHADRATQVANLLFGAVHFLLLGGIDDPLAAFYADLVDTPQPPAAGYPVFRAFCLKHARTIQDLVATRRVQTNEVGRCAGLLPAFSLIAERVAPAPLAIIEIGASAGLHMLWDSYRYDYGAHGQIGDSSSPVVNRCEARGAYPPPIPAQLPPVVFRAGIDLNPIDVNDPDSVRWLRALVWPEHRDRAALLDQALHLAQERPIRIVAGSAPDVLPGLIARAPSGAALCIYHSYTLNQMPADIRQGTLRALADRATRRPLFRIAQEWFAGQDQPHLELHTYQGSRVSVETLAYCESHGRWLQWLGDRDSLAVSLPDDEET